MAEIKSTLDLIMEKTAGLVMTDAEKEESRSREQEKRAKGLTLRLLEGTLRIKDLLREIERSGGDDPEEFKRQVGTSLIRESDLGALSQDGPGAGLEEALAVLFPEQADRLRGLLAQAEESYNQELARLGRAEIEKVLEELKRRGIYGPAIRPRVVVDMDQDRFKEDLLESLKMI